jgi:hypothetical protein
VEKNLLRVVAVAFLFLFLPVCLLADLSKDRKSEAHLLADEISRKNIHKLYVPDVCDASSHPNGLNASFASAFSQLLAKSKVNFALLDRAEAHRYLLAHQLTDCDLLKSGDTLLTFAANFGVDSLLLASVNPTDTSFVVDFHLRDIAGTELFHSSYTELVTIFNLDDLTPTAASGGWPFYFISENITRPEPLQIVKPHSIHGTIAFSARVGVTGKVTNIRFERKLQPDTEHKLLSAIQLWDYKPAKTSDGTPVPIRMPFEFTF